MKKAFFTLAVALLAATGAWAQTTFTADNLKYTVTDAATHTVELTGYESALAGEVNIPATVTNESTEYSVTSIGSYAFSWCSQLTAVTIPASVTNIGSSAFSWCSQLTAVTIPEGVATIGSYAFESCSSLTVVNIPASVTNIGNWVFDYCSALTAIHVAEGNTAYSSEDGVLFNKDKTTLVCYPIGKTETTYTVPATVTTFTTSAFENCTALAQINLPNSLTDMKSRTFYGCTSLKEVTLPDGVTQLMGSNFTDCSALEKVTLPEGITYIGSGAFKNCSALTELTVWAITPPTLGSDAFTGVGSSLVVKVPAEGLPAYQTADIWKDFTLQGNGQVPFVVENLKYRVTSQTENTVEVMGYQTAPTGALTIPATVTNESTEYSVTSIGSSAFRSCSSLTAVTIPASVTNIGSWAFSLCSQLTAVTIPEGVATIGNYAFGYCYSLTAVNIPASAINIGNWLFDYCSALTAINVASGNTAYCSENGILFNKDKTTLICYPAGKPQLEYTIPSSVTVIGVNAFAYCDALTQLTIPSSVTSIGEWAFDGCTALAEMTVLATVPPTLIENVFRNVDRNIPVYVPAASLAAYQAAEVWNEFKLQGISTTGLPAAVMPESISMKGGLLHNPQGLHLSLYDMQGRQVYSGNDNTVSQPAGVYVLRCNGASGKVLF